MYKPEESVTGYYEWERQVHCCKPWGHSMQRNSNFPWLLRSLLRIYLSDLLGWPVLTKPTLNGWIQTAEGTYCEKLFTEKSTAHEGALLCKYSTDNSIWGHSPHDFSWEIGALTRRKSFPTAYNIVGHSTELGIYVAKGFLVTQISASLETST